MTEQSIEKALSKARGFSERQQLLKQLWKLCRERETEAASTATPLSSDKAPEASGCVTSAARIDPRHVVAKLAPIIGNCP
jgi:acyl-CoA reductase-like NAD-dependent aldehyde dehydrogenase